MLRQLLFRLTLFINCVNYVSEKWKLSSERILIIVVIILMMHSSHSQLQNLIFFALNCSIPVL